LTPQNLYVTFTRDPEDLVASSATRWSHAGTEPARTNLEEKMNASVRARRALAHGIMGALLLTACNGNGAEPDGTEQPENGGQGGRTELAASELTAPLAGGYKVRPNGERVPPTEDELPVPIGSVEAHWYRSGGVYVVAFAGLDLEEAGPVCPGSSIQTDAGFEHVTNAPTEEGACEGAPNLAASGAGVRTCGPLVLYITEIPEDTEGALYASVERYEDNGRIIGVTGVVDADMSAAPGIDPEANGYTLPEGLVEGTTEVTC
jgi:hypothetical protein